MGYVENELAKLDGWRSFDTVDAVGLATLTVPDGSSQVREDSIFPNEPALRTPLRTPPTQAASLAQHTDLGGASGRWLGPDSGAPTTPDGDL